METLGLAINPWLQGGAMQFLNSYYFLLGVIKDGLIAKSVNSQINPPVAQHWFCSILILTGGR